MEIVFGPLTIMLSEEFPEMGYVAPQGRARVPSMIHLHVDDADAMIASAVAAGATVVREPKDQFYGERSGNIRDPFGYEWNIGHEIEHVSTDEMQRRYTAMMENG